MRCACCSEDLISRGVANTLVPPTRSAENKCQRARAAEPGELHRVNRSRSDFASFTSEVPNPSVTSCKLERGHRRPSVRCIQPLSGPTLWRNGVRKVELLAGGPRARAVASILYRFDRRAPRTAATKPPAGPFPPRDTFRHNSCNSRSRGRTNGPELPRCHLAVNNSPPSRSRRGWCAERLRFVSSPHALSQGIQSPLEIA